MNKGKSEAAVQTEIMVKASELGMRLWRNNVGACVDANGNHLRYGLCNSSKQMNAVFKSSDLIGIRPVTITQDMVGSVIGQFVSIEAKREGWRRSMKNTREAAQAKWLDLVRSLGGYAKFSTGDLDNE